MECSIHYSILTWSTADGRARLTVTWNRRTTQLWHPEVVVWSFCHLSVLITVTFPNSIPLSFRTYLILLLASATPSSSPEGLQWIFPDPSVLGVPPFSSSLLFHTVVFPRDAILFITHISVFMLLSPSSQSPLLISYMRTIYTKSVI